MPLVLLTDDNDINRFFAVRVLKKMGITPDEAINGIQAVQLASEKNYDLILMDIQMPEMDGIEATKIILSKSSDSLPKIIAITANASGADVSEYKNAGFIDMIAKPYKPEHLINTVKYWLEKDTAHAEGAQAQQDGASDEDPVFDNKNLVTWANELGEKPEEFIQDSLNNFITQTTKIINSIPTLSSDDELRIAAHTLKGSALTMGAIALGNAAKVLEQAVKNGEKDSYPLLKEKVFAEFARFLHFHSKM